jgi:hypothetical protein
MYGFGWNEDKPAAVQQGRYRVGDRVRVVDARGGGNVGDVATVTRVESVPGGDDYCYLPDLGPDIEGLFAYRLSPAFRPGDRVKLNKHSGVRACGERGTVSAVIGDNVSVRMDDASAYGTVVAFFHADNLDWERVEDVAGKQHATSARVPWEEVPKPKLPPKPKFKAGDVVRCVESCTDLLFADHLYTVTKSDFPDNMKCGTVNVTSDFASLKTRRYRWPETYFELVQAPSRDEPPPHRPWGMKEPCIVALISNGKPRPSQWPHAHASVEAATKEAERLARNNPGQEFAVYQRVAGRVAEQHIEMKEVA